MILLLDCSKVTGINIISNISLLLHNNSMWFTNISFLLIREEVDLPTGYHLRQQKEKKTNINLYREVQDQILFPQKWKEVFGLLY